MAQAIRDILRACAESGGVDEATGRFNAPALKLTPVECRAMAMKVRDNMITSLARRGEVERRFEEDDQLEDEDYEVRAECKRVEESACGAWMAGWLHCHPTPRSYPSIHL